MKDFIRKKLITELINKNTITCDKCNWKWDKSDSEEKDLYICHKCGHDNEPLKENLQQADKIYFNTGALSPKVKEIITTRITNGDVYTKFICDVYYAELQQQHSIGDWVVNSNDNPKYEPEKDKVYKPEDDVLGLKAWKEIKETYEQAKTYNKNVFPIENFDITNTDYKTIWPIIRGLKIRSKIIDKFSTLPSVGARNLKNDIRQVRSDEELQRYYGRLEYFLGLYSQLSNRDEKLHKVILNKMFKGNTSLDELIDFAEEKENLLGGAKFTRNMVINMVRESNHGELEVIYNKGNYMVVEVSGPYGIKEIGCNSLWCFTYGKGFNEAYRQWDNYSTNDTVYVIIDFSEPSDSQDFMYVLIKPIDFNVDDNESITNEGKLFNMANEPHESPLLVLSQTIGLETAKKLFTFGIEPVKPEPIKAQKKSAFVDPNQTSLFERRKRIKTILRERIEASEAHSAEGSLETVLSGKRSVGLTTEIPLETILDKIGNQNIKVVNVTPPNSEVREKYITSLMQGTRTSHTTAERYADTNLLVYRDDEDGRFKAKKLLSMMIDRDGFVSDDSKAAAMRIGTALGYNKDSISNYINKRYNVNENELINEVAKTIDDLPKETALFVDQNGNMIDIVLYTPSDNRIIGAISSHQAHKNKPINAISGVAANTGYGPLLYELMMNVIYPRYLMPSRDGAVRSDAWNVWVRFFNDRNDINKITLPISDDMFNFSIIGIDEDMETDDKEETYNGLDIKNKKGILIFNTLFQANKPINKILIDNANELIKSGSVNFNEIIERGDYFITDSYD